MRFYQAKKGQTQKPHFGKQCNKKVMGAQLGVFSRKPNPYNKFLEKPVSEQSKTSFLRFYQAKKGQTQKPTFGKQCNKKVTGAQLGVFSKKCSQSFKYKKMTYNII